MDELPSSEAKGTIDLVDHTVGVTGLGYGDSTESRILILAVESENRK